MENTDLKLLTDMLRRANVPFTRHDRKGKPTTVDGIEYQQRVVVAEEPDAPDLVETYVGDFEKQHVGYTGVLTEFYFGKDGQLVAVGAWE
jgi:hypothetical protein